MRHYLKAFGLVCLGVPVALAFWWLILVGFPAFAEWTLDLPLWADIAGRVICLTIIVGTILKFIDTTEETNSKIQPSTKTERNQP